MTAAEDNPGEAAVRSIERTCCLAIDGRRAARALANWARQFELSEPEFLALWSLRDVSDGGVDQTTLAQRLALSPAQISATVERLRAHDWIVQHFRPGDRRRHLWQLSDSGRALLDTMLKIGSKTNKWEGEAPAEPKSEGLRLGGSLALPSIETAAASPERAREAAA